ncbi:M56 family metallopeptidase [Cesiribacter sp. SM1]|uniref:M56 family metallopeptidase n=1 Tax=Cesiribacter sp. SM1 TaxID=2861196 RepID=UPI001CD520BC|nr:M56 family metallopeptidase [Cesiribacter sp. SM1]
MIALLLKASFVIGIALLFYKSVLQQENFFATNRLYLLCCIFLAFALPYVALPKLVQQQGYLATIIRESSSSDSAPVLAETTLPTPAPQHEHSKSEAAPTTTATAVENAVENNPKALENSSSSSIGEKGWMFWLLMLYFFGVVIFALNLLLQAGSILYKAIRATDKIEDMDCTIINTAGKQAPCSFFRYIFIHPDDYDYDTYQQIIAHEKIHIRLGHSLDLLIAEIATVILWFNPLIWLLKREIEKNLEFQTDALLLEETAISKREYQLSLLQIATPHKPLSITTNYNQSLLKQRILMMNAKKSTLHSYWKYAFLAPLLFGTLLLLNEPATSQTTPPLTEEAPLQEEQTETVSEQEEMTIPIEAHEDISEGYWYSQQSNDQYCLALKGKPLASRESDRNTYDWSITECFDKALIEKKEAQVFELKRESGTLSLMGALDQEVSQGKYKFTKDPSFENYLASNNIRSGDKNLIFFLFMNDVDRKYIDFLKEHYSTINGDRLLELAVHDISIAEFKDLIALFNTYNNSKPTMQEVVEAHIHDIDAAYVQEIQAMGFKNLSLRKMMEMKIHDISPTFINGLKEAGYEALSADKIIEAKVHDLNPQAIQEIRALGYNLSMDKIIQFKIHEVNADYIAELNAAGFQNLDADQILTARIHDISASTIQEIRRLGFDRLSFDDVVQANIHEIDAAYLAGLKAAGFDNLSMDEIVAARVHDINGDFIKKAREKGFNFDDLDRYVALKIHGFADNIDVD